MDMPVVVITNLKENKLPAQLAPRLEHLLFRKEMFVCISSDFTDHKAGDDTLAHAVAAFSSTGITCACCRVIDSRTTPDEARSITSSADVVWLMPGAGEDNQFLAGYGLIDVLKKRRGLIFTSDGAFSDIRVKEDDDHDGITTGSSFRMCGDSFIICQNGKHEFHGEIYRIQDGSQRRMGTKQVLLLGDSLRMGYEPVVRRLLEETACVLGPDENGRWAGYTLNSLRFWRGQYPDPDVIHWNNGLWDLGDDYKLGRPFSLPDEYESALERTVTVLQKLYPKAKIVMATIMPTANPDSADIEAYNEILKRVAARHDLPVDDLFPITKAEPSLIGPDTIHLTDEGWERVGAAVADSIRALL